MILFIYVYWIRASSFLIHCVVMFLQQFAKHHSIWDNLVFSSCRFSVRPIWGPLAHWKVFFGLNIALIFVYSSSLNSTYIIGARTIASNNLFLNSKNKKIKKIIDWDGQTFLAMKSKSELKATFFTSYDLLFPQQYKYLYCTIQYKQYKDNTCICIVTASLLRARHVFHLLRRYLTLVTLNNKCYDACRNAQSLRWPFILAGYFFTWNNVTSEICTCETMQ